MMRTAATVKSISIEFWTIEKRSSQHGPPKRLTGEGLESL
jgi:hypothetical protein